VSRQTYGRPEPSQAFGEVEVFHDREVLEPFKRAQDLTADEHCRITAPPAKQAPLRGVDNPEETATDRVVVEAEGEVAAGDPRLAAHVVSKVRACGLGTVVDLVEGGVITETFTRVPREVTDAIREDRRIPDPKLAALSAFTRAMVQTRGRPSRQDVADFLAVGYSERQVLEIILAIAVKTLSNYTNHLFGTPVDPAFAARVWRHDDVEARA
jgi:alkylhydroperoxidase family enzyme